MTVLDEAPAVTPLLDAPVLTEPGVYDIPEAVYHGDPVPGGSLSASGAKKLLPPYCPALFRWEQDHPVHKDVLDFGSAAHKVMLGAGPDVEIIAADDWRTKAAKEARDAAREAGKIPVLEADWQRVQDMASALRAHPVAASLFDPSHGGTPEQSLFWEDRAFGIWRRSRLDWLPDAGPRRFVIRDYKTCASAEPGAVSRAMANFGYHMSAAWYMDAVEALGLADDPAFIFCFQERTPPYLITVAELDFASLRTGRELNRAAMERYRDCREAGVWPGYSDGIELISLPSWALSRGDYL